MTLPAPSSPLPADAKFVELPRGYRLVRVYDPGQDAWDAHRFYGPIGSGRFDHQPPPTALHPNRSVWYAGNSLRGAVAESFGKLGFLDRDCGRMVVVARVDAPILVLELLGAAVKRLKLTQEIATTTDYPLCQSYARAFYEQFAAIQGIRWRGREIGSVNVVLNDRTEMTALSPEVDEEITQPSIWPRVARAAKACGLDIV